MSSAVGRTYNGASFSDHLQRGFDAYLKQWQAWLIPSLIFTLIVLVTSCVLFLSIGPLSCGMYFLAFRCLKNQPVDSAGLGRGREVLESAMAAGAVLFLLQLGPVLLLYGAMFASFFAVAAAAGPNGDPSPIIILLSMAVFGVAVLAFMAFSIWITTRTMFVFPLIADRGLDYKSAFRESFRATKEGFWWLLLTHFIANMIAQLGGSFCVVGMFFTIPLYFTILAGAYDEEFGIQSVTEGPGPVTAEIVPPRQPPGSTRETGNPYQS